MTDNNKQYGADLVVDSLINHDIDYVLVFLVLKLIVFLTLLKIRDHS